MLGRVGELCVASVEDVEVVSMALSIPQVVGTMMRIAVVDAVVGAD